MNGDLRINGIDHIYERWGVKMGDGFLDVLTEALTPKAFIENESRLEHGKHVVVTEDIVKIASREILLDFTIEGKTPEDFSAKKKTFLSAMYRGNVTIQVPAVSDDTYHLIYRGKGTEYGMNYQRTFCHMVLKFEEPNPMDRAERAGVTN